MWHNLLSIPSFTEEVRYHTDRVSFVNTYSTLHFQFILLPNLSSLYYKVIIELFYLRSVLQDMWINNF